MIGAPGMSRALVAAGLVALGACKADDLTARDHAADYLGPASRRWIFVPQGDPTASPLQIEATEGSWEVRVGERWRDAAPLARWDVTVDPDLTVDGERLVPEVIEVGAASEGVAVTAVGEREVWYGTFDRAVTVEVDDGPFAGEHAFARGYGPILLTWDRARSGLTAEVWELGGYEDP